MAAINTLVTPAQLLEYAAVLDIAHMPFPLICNSEYYTAIGACFVCPFNQPHRCLLTTKNPSLLVTLKQLRATNPELFV